MFLFSISALASFISLFLFDLLWFVFVLLLLLFTITLTITITIFWSLSLFFLTLVFASWTLVFFFFSFSPVFSTVWFIWRIVRTAILRGLWSFLLFWAFIPVSVFGFILSLSSLCWTLIRIICGFIGLFLIFFGVVFRVILFGSWIFGLIGFLIYFFHGF